MENTARKFTAEIIASAIASNVKPEGMCNAYWYKIRKNAGVEIKKETKWDKNVIRKAIVDGKKPEGMSSTYWYKVRKANESNLAELAELEKKAARKAKYDAKKDEINARRRANRAAKKAAELSSVEA